jgi:hypothetical protein
VFENIVQMRIFGPKRDEIFRGWRKLHNEELNLYSSPHMSGIIKFRRMTWAGREEKCIKVLERKKTERK